VLEWAEEGDVNIDELRRKAGVGFGDGSDIPGKKRKLVLTEDRDDREDDV
jgi:multiple RNA-binding domain-containing protein 1